MSHFYVFTAKLAKACRNEKVLNRNCQASTKQNFKM